MIYRLRVITIIIIINISRAYEDAHISYTRSIKGVFVSVFACSCMTNTVYAKDRHRPCKDLVSTQQLEFEAMMS